MMQDPDGRALAAPYAGSVKGAQQGPYIGSEPAAHDPADRDAHAGPDGVPNDRAVSQAHVHPDSRPHVQAVA